MPNTLKFTLLVKDNKTGKTTAVYSDFKESLTQLQRILNDKNPCSSIIKGKP